MKTTRTQRETAMVADAIRTHNARIPRTRRTPGECEVCEENRMVAVAIFKMGGCKRVARVCRSCAATGREMERDEMMTAATN